MCGSRLEDALFRRLTHKYQKNSSEANKELVENSRSMFGSFLPPDETPTHVRARFQEFVQQMTQETDDEDDEDDASDHDTRETHLSSRSLGIVSGTTAAPGKGTPPWRRGRGDRGV